MIFSPPAADFNLIGGTMVTFRPSDAVGTSRCVMFDPVEDKIVEEDERMEFRAMASNSLDVFDGDNGIFQTVVDDDGIYLNYIYIAHG